MASAFQATSNKASSVLDEILLRLEGFVLGCWYHPLTQVGEACMARPLHMVIG